MSSQPHTDSTRATGPERNDRIWLAAVIALTGMFYILGAMLSQRRAFDPDEFLHTHLAWAISKGQLPYRDYFDHYTPLFHVFLAPFLRFFNVETNGVDSIAFLFFARKLAWLTSGFVVYLTYRLGRMWRNTATGLVAALFLITAAAYWNLTIEIRPDTLATSVWLLFLVSLVCAVQRTYRGLDSRILFLGSGMLLAIGFVTSQKNVYAFPGLAAAMLYYLFKPGQSTFKSRFFDVLSQFIGFCLPLAATAGFFYLNNGLAQFIRYNFLFYLGVVHESPIPVLLDHLYQHPFLGIFGAFGLLRALAALLPWKALPWRGDYVLAPAALALIVGLFLIPTPLYQYYILFLPLVAIFAAAFLLDAVDILLDLRTRWRLPQWAGLALAMTALSFGIILALARGAGSPWPLYLIAGYWLGGIGVCMALLGCRLRTASMVAFFVIMCVSPAVRLVSMLRSPGSTPQLEEIRYIVANTTPSEVVMDGYQGSGVFRPHAYFYWFLPYTDRSGITDAEKQQLLGDLNSGVIAPRFILMDINLRDLSPSIGEFLERNYESVGVGVIRKRRQAAQASLAPGSVATRR